MSLVLFDKIFTILQTMQDLWQQCMSLVLFDKIYTILHIYIPISQSDYDECLLLRFMLASQVHVCVLLDQLLNLSLFQPFCMIKSRLFDQNVCTSAPFFLWIS